VVFYVGGVECKTRIGYKGLPQGSVLSPLLYNLLVSGVGRFILSGCNFLQYADEIDVYSSHHNFEIAGTLVQTACSSLSVFFSMIGLTILATKSEVVLFSRKHLQPVVSIPVNGRLLPQSISFLSIWVYSITLDLDGVLSPNTFRSNVCKD
jgi:hypothetical protein